jgi:hypothetical protein
MNGYDCVRELADSPRIKCKYVIPKRLLHTNAKMNRDTTNLVDEKQMLTFESRYLAAFLSSFLY